MKKTLTALLFALLTLPCVHAQDSEKDRDNDRSREMTPNSPRKVTMANPIKPGWQAEPHGK